MQWLDRIPISFLIVMSIIFGLAPFVPEPHALEKVRMLLHGSLTRPIDIFDLVFHLLPLLLLLLRLAGKIIRRNGNADT